MDVATAPVIEVSPLVGKTPLRHNRIFAAFVSEIGADLTGDAHFACATVNAFGVFKCFFLSPSET